MTCRPGKFCHKIWAILVVVVAVCFGVFAFRHAPLPVSEWANAPIIMHTLRVILMLLGIGALIKYLFSCPSCAYCIVKEKTREGVQIGTTPKL